jgi:hypothetical protein
MDADPGERTALRFVGLFICAIAVGLVTGPWWSARLRPSDDILLVELLGVMFGGLGLQLAIPPDRAQWLRTLGFCAWIGGMGVFCLAIACAGLVSEDYARHHLIGSMSGLVPDVPAWARIVCGAFALLLLGIVAKVVIGVVRDGFSGRRTP